MTDALVLTRENPILATFRAALAEMYGDRLERVMLFGSRARGDTQPDDDVAVFLNGMNGSSDRWAEWSKLADLRVNSLRKPAFSSMPNRIRRARTATVRRSCRKSGVRDWTCDARSQPVLAMMETRFSAMPAEQELQRNRRAVAHAISTPQNRPGAKSSIRDVACAPSR